MKGKDVKDLTKMIVAGAGIGGSTAAIALRRAGFEVAVLERAAELREVGMLEALRQIAAMPDDSESRPRECGHPQMRLFPNGPVYCLALRPSSRYPLGPSIRPGSRRGYLDSERTSK